LLLSEGELSLIISRSVSILVTSIPAAQHLIGREPLERVPSQEAH
jgi:hypothetical protein